MQIIRNVQYALIIIGLLISSYLTYSHYTNTQLACPEVGVLNCEAVTTSPYSMIFGVPVALLGLILFLLAVLMLLSKNDTLIFAWSIGAFMGAMYSIGSMAILGLICIYCVSLDCVMLLTILVSYVGTMRKGHGD